MGMPDDGEQAKVRERLRTLCLDLNVDAGTEEDAWEAFDRLSYNYTLEGDSLHWLACCLYVSCRLCQVASISGLEEIEGNFVSLTRLLRTTKLSLIEFFKKMLKWVDMASLPANFRDKVNRLERNFCVSTVTFRKFLPIFKDIFNVNNDQAIVASTTSANEAIHKGIKGRRSKRTTVNVGEVFVFCWTAFVQVKGKFSSISDDLVNCFHLLLCCVDWVFANALLSNRTDLLNPNFQGLPKNFVLRDYRPPSKPPCILSDLCHKYLGIEIEAKEIKNYYWKAYIRKLFENKVLVGNAENLMRVLEIENFDKNNKALNKAYEEYVLNSGDFDEREFIGGTNPEIPSPPSTCNNAQVPTANSQVTIPSCNNEEGGQDTLIKTFEKRLKTLQLEAFSEHKPLHLHTPLTNRRYLGSKDAIFSPVSTATHSVGALLTLLADRKGRPSDELTKIFNSCSHSPADKIAKQIGELGKIFCQSYMQTTNGTPSTSTSDNTPMDFSQPRLQLSISLYYSLLEKIILSESRNPSLSNSMSSIPETLLGQADLHKTLFAVSIEIVLFSYNSHKVFPWVIDTLEIPAFSFYKVIEIVNRVERGLSRDIVKHLNRVEETILDWLVWKNDSVLWQVLEKFGDVPSVADVLLPSQFSNATQTTTTSSSFSSPVNNVMKVMVNLAGSPVNRPIHETFVSPIPTRRRLFDTPTTTLATTSAASTTSVVKTQARQQLVLTTAPSKPVTHIKLPAKQQHIVISAAQSCRSPGSFIVPPSSPPMLIFKTSPIATRQTRQTTTTLSSTPSTTSTQTTSAVTVAKTKLTTTKLQPTKPVKRKLQDATPLTEAPPPKLTTSTSSITTTATSASSNTDNPTFNKPKKSGSVPLFFRKVYTLASTRLRDLCEKLSLNEGCVAKIWTCLEHTIMHHTSVLMDRHLDQIIMCCVYVICKVTKESKQFQDIMKCYRLQPQAQSHVYRSVLLKVRGEDGVSKATQGTTNPTNKTANQASARDDRRLRREKEIEMNSARSNSSMHFSLPPSPTQMAGTSTSFQFEERGDLIKFYNSVFLPLVKSFAFKFDSNAEKNSEVVLSPLPAIRNQPLSPRRISSNVYVSPINHSTSNTPISPSNPLFCSSNQSLDLQKLNSLIQKEGARKKARNLKNMDQEVSGENVFRRRLTEAVTNWKSVNNAA